MTAAMILCSRCIPYPRALDPNGSPGLGEFARVARAHRVHVFWIVGAAERSDNVGLGATSSMPAMGSRERNWQFTATSA